MVSDQAAPFHTITLPDGASLAYNVYGTEHLSVVTPFVLIGGMSSRRDDWIKLREVLCKNRPVLVFDHRGMGDSTYSSSAKDDEITVESMARDLLCLLTSLGWKEVDLCGYSMGGAILQQLLFLPYNQTNPTYLPFKYNHVVLAATLATANSDPKYGLKFPFKPGEVSHIKLSEEQLKDAMRPTVEATFDPVWIQQNPERFNWWLDSMIRKRPSHTILKQRKAMNPQRYNFTGLHARLPTEPQYLVIAGTLDRVVPSYKGEEIMKLIPGAIAPSIGTEPGQIPTDQFGHCWWEYFDIGVWKDLLETFLDSPVPNKAVL